MKSGSDEKAMHFYELAESVFTFNPDARNKKNQTVLHIAAKKGNFVLLQFCISKTTEVNVPSYYLISPFLNSHQNKVTLYFLECAARHLFHFKHVI